MKILIISQVWNNNFSKMYLAVIRSARYTIRVFRVGRAIHRAPFEIYNTQCARSFHYLGSEATTRGGRKENLRARSQTFFSSLSSFFFPLPIGKAICCRSGTNGLGTFSYGIVFHGWLLLMPNFRFIRRPERGSDFALRQLRQPANCTQIHAVFHV